MKKEKIVKLSFYVMASLFVIPIALFVWPAFAVVFFYNYADDIEVDINPYLAYFAAIGSTLAWIFFLAWLQGNITQ